MKFLRKEILVAAVLLLLPLLSFAQSTPTTPSNPRPPAGGGTPTAPSNPQPPAGGTPTTPSNTQPPAGGTQLNYELQNPLAFDSLQDFIVALINVFIVIATPIVVVFIILAGFKYVTAQGNPSKIEEATRSLMYAIIGGVLIIGAVAISYIIRDLVTAFS